MRLLTAVLLLTGNGEFIIVLDSEDRENEGDLIIAADSITTRKMAFMVRHSSGYICAPILPNLATHLELPQMVTQSTDPHRTAYTVSIDSNDPSVTTGISAHNRALTCRTLASPDVKPSSFRRPGHILPLQAKVGGVRERRGHTEATVDFCRLAGKFPAGVICELVEDGESPEGVAERSGGGMLRRDGCLKFGKKWGIKVCTIEALVEYLEKTEGPLPVVNGKHS
ncbi:uncharacterized protein ARB_07451 [Trichophyton benhamiae CBS 112371]|uniref:3,4-dihydroxy-2-butanone 4-phosphate synthase n=1 Tax=Arthroderma benhamiae (strain ATCC MYA-4681 / CBS 112371) TaxID=663331 RepID=D4AT87_ARTBC|nr:uncharacterized protein ARB_07451 [Trichophyton benhamiae CBS 112371]EFE33506.1 hypothetical protein ARB_07451 [Trichophyton benhamiae CBS 112371]